MNKLKIFHRGTRDDIDNEDEQESYFRYMEENPNAGVINEEEDIIDYDSDGNPIIERKKVDQMNLLFWKHIFFSNDMSELKFQELDYG